jgi:uncharacterized protein YhjY with autotransporter beta-barrel domain
VDILGDTNVEADEAFQIQLSDPVNATIASGTSAVTIINDDFAVIVTPDVISSATVGVAYSQVLAANGGIAPYVFQISSGSLPVGLSLVDNRIEGVARADGVFSFTASATDANGVVGSRSYTLSVDSPSIVFAGSPLPAAQIGINYATQLPEATGGSAPYIYRVISGALPGGLSLEGATRVVSGTPDSQGSFTFTVEVRDSTQGQGPYTATQNFTIEVVDRAPVANPASLTLAYGASTTLVPLPITGGSPTSVAVVAPPSNGTVRVDGLQVYYQPVGDFAGRDTFTYSASNAIGTSAAALITIDVQPPNITIQATGPLTTRVGDPYSLIFSVQGGSEPYGGQSVRGLPAGLLLSDVNSDSLIISGTPIAAGTFMLEVEVTDASIGDGPFTASRTFTLTVEAPTLALSPASGVLTSAYGVAYAQVFSASGGIGPYTYSLTGPLPPGMSFSGNVLSGTPLGVGDYPIQVAATDTGTSPSVVIGQTYTLTISPPSIILSPNVLPPSSSGAPYAQLITAFGGLAPYTFVVSSGELPAGLLLEASGTLSGTPTQAGSFVFEISAADANGQVGTGRFALEVAAPTLILMPDVLTSGQAGLAYSQTFVASGGLSPYRYIVARGELPTGLSLDEANGILTGVPTEAGSFAFTIMVNDSTTGSAGVVSHPYVLTILAPVIVITPERLPDGTVLAPYEQKFVASGGSAPYVYALESGMLPEGLQLDSDGRLYGSPRVSGAYTLVIMAIDALGFTGSRSYQLDVHSRPDPSRDPEVRGVLEAQVQSVRRFAMTQADNIQRRIEGLSGPSSSAAMFSNGIAFSQSSPCIDRAGDGLRCSAPVPYAPPDLPPEVYEDDSTPSSLHLWSAGSIRSGNADGRGASNVAFETDGITLGADYYFTDRLALGAVLGFGRETAEVGFNGSQVEGDAATVAGYFKFHVTDEVYLSGLLGYQSLSFDIRRALDSGALAVSSRSGSQRLVSLSAGIERRRDAYSVTSYARLDGQRARLDTFTERADALYALTFAPQNIGALTTSLGSRMEWRNDVGWGSFSPQVRLEIQRDIESDSTARLNYAEAADEDMYSLRLLGFDRTRAVIGLGARFVLQRDFSLRVEYRGLFGTGGDTDHGVLLNVEKRY